MVDLTNLKACTVVSSKDILSLLRRAALTENLRSATAFGKIWYYTWGGCRPLSRIFVLNSDGLKHFRLILGLAEFMRKTENSANLWLSVNCG